MSVAPESTTPENDVPPPRRALTAWLERRTGWPSFFARHGRGWQVPARAGLFHVLGGVLLLGLVAQAVTGALLLFHFEPDPSLAFESVRHLMRDVPFGWLMRLAHAHVANWLVALLFVHLFATALRGAYKAPREMIWWTGCLLFVMVLAAALTGYILPWSQMSYWATTVVTASVEYAPFAGPELVALVRGGELVGDATYRRAFAAHVALLPFALIALAALHVALIRRAGLAGPATRKADLAERAETTVPFFPDHALRYAIAITAFAILVAGTLFFAPNLFFPAESFLPADPFDTPANVKPEWYFLWAYQLPRILPESVAILLQGVALAVLFGLPLLDRSPHRHPFDRPLASALLFAGGALLLGLSVAGYLA